MGIMVVYDEELFVEIWEREVGRKEYSIVIYVDVWFYYNYDVMFILG